MPIFSFLYLDKNLKLVSFGLVVPCLAKLNNSGLICTDKTRLVQVGYGLIQDLPSLAKFGEFWPSFTKLVKVCSGSTGLVQVGPDLYRLSLIGHVYKFLIEFDKYEFN